MEVTEARIPSAYGSDFLLRLFNVHIQPPRINKPKIHSHIELEIAYFKSGIGIYSTENKKYDIRPGDIFLFAGNEQHCISDAFGKEEMVLMNIHFEPRFIWSAGNDLFDAKYLKIFLNRSNSFENRLSRDNPATHEIARLMLEIEREFSEKRPEYTLMVKVNLLNILVRLMRDFDYVGPEAEQSSLKKSSFSMIERSMAYIDSHISEHLTLDDLAETASMSSTYYCSVFKQLNGISPWEYLTAKRIERAAEMIKGSDCTMLEIALACGFNNTANFNRAFKHCMNKTPSEYRKNLTDYQKKADTM
jgi:AraC-like DNA-binding protein/mannose-6-phosphate isomerase-like protein (cupin superfamily)